MDVIDSLIADHNRFAGSSPGIKTPIRRITNEASELAEKITHELEIHMAA